MSRVSVVSGSEGRFPKSLPEFQRRFATESAGAEYPFERRWPEGFVCLGCGEGCAWLLKTKAFTYECDDCGRPTSVTAGTIMHASKLPLTIWFWAAFLMATHSNGISALQLQSQLSLGSYRTAWMLAAKLRRAMVNPEREPLSGLVEADETIIPFRTQERPGRRARRPQRGRQDAGRRRRRNRRRHATARPAQGDRRLWQAGTSCLRARRCRPANPAGHRRLAVLPEPSGCPARRDHPRPDGGTHRAALDPSAVFKPQALGPGRLSRTAENKPPALP